jgi:hypothetical protein
MTRRLLIPLIVVFSMLTGISPANAHNVTSQVNAVFPYYTGDAVRLDGIHKITGCANNGDGQTCAQGIDFKAEISCQMFVAGGWRNCDQTIFSTVRHYPDRVQATAVMWLSCQPTDSDVTIRGRARGWVKHLGSWYPSVWALGLSLTVRCLN